MNLFALALLLQWTTPHESTTPNEFFARGMPTFVAGTLGDDRSDRIVRGQIELLRALLFPAAEVVDDVALAPASGERAWPALPVLYGGPHVNAVVAALDLPFEVAPGRLQLEGTDPYGGCMGWTEDFIGTDLRLIAVVPAAEASLQGPAHPEFLLYAGTGSPGVGEINAIPHGDSPLLVADTFGVLVEGELWKESNGGINTRLGERRPRPEWRLASAGSSAWSVGHTGERGKSMGLRIFLPEARGYDPGSGSEAVFDALRGVQTKLGLARESVDLALYVYPDRETKAAITGNPGDGHADPEGRSLHVVAQDPAALASLVAHEGTHALAFAAWGMAGTPALGEGLAVWASGGYGGTSLEDWRARLRGATPPAIALVLGPEFRRSPEPKVYPLAGLFVSALVDEVGLDGLREHLYGATPATWNAACERAGSSAVAIERRFGALFAP